MTLLREDPPLSELPNLRDLGGLPVEGGGFTRHAVLLRSAAPHAGDQVPDVAWPPSDVVDLRSPGEVEPGGHPLACSDTTVHEIALVPGTRPKPKQGWAGVPDLRTMYRYFVDRRASGLVRVLEIAANAEGPVLVHCAAGKDRTGIAVAVLLRAAGVDRDAVVADYTRTLEHIQHVLAREKFSHGPQDPTHFQKLMGAPAEAIIDVLDVVEAAGDARSWLRTHGASEADLDRWRARLVG